MYSRLSPLLSTFLASTFFSPANCFSTTTTPAVILKGVTPSMLGSGSIVVSDLIVKVVVPVVPDPLGDLVGLRLIKLSTFDRVQSVKTEK